MRFSDWSSDVCSSDLQSRTVRIVSMAVAIPLSMTACDRKMVDTPDDPTNLAANVMEQPEPVSPPTLSIMRPSVSDEDNPTPAQPHDPLNEQNTLPQGGTALADQSHDHTATPPPHTEHHNGDNN